jgi:hypothetical protein
VQRSSVRATVVPEKKVCQLLILAWSFVASSREIDSGHGRGVRTKAVHSLVRSCMTPDISDQVVQECNSCETEGKARVTRVDQSTWMLQQSEAKN